MSVKTRTVEVTVVWRFPDGDFGQQAHVFSRYGNRSRAIRVAVARTLRYHGEDVVIFGVLTNATEAIVDSVIDNLRIR